MGWRFRRSFKILPGLRLNIGKKSVSVSAGPRGLTTTVGKTGVHQNVGLPGTGLSYRTKVEVPKASNSRSLDNEVDPIVSDQQFSQWNYQQIERSNGRSSVGFFVAIGVIALIALLVILAILVTLL